MQSDDRTRKDYVLYIAGRRVSALDNFSYSSGRDELIIGDGERLRPTKVEVKFSIAGADLERFWSAMERAYPERERRRRAAHYRRALRRELVRFAGRSGQQKARLKPEQREFLNALGVHVPRSLR